MPLRPPPRPWWQDGGRAGLWLGDAVAIMNRLPAGSVPLVFADPPFNLGMPYDVHNDAQERSEYLRWSQAWLTAAARLLRPDATLWVAIGLSSQAEVKQLAEGAGLVWRDTVAWHYTFGPRQTTRLTPSWVALHYFTKHRSQFTFHAEAVRVPSARQLKYRDRRAVPAGKMPDNCWVLLPAEYQSNGVCFQPGQNAWLGSRVCGTFQERTGHPCQMPEAVLRRIVRLSSNPGDVVFDPFLGSGTTAVAAVKEGRCGWGCELSEDYLSQYVRPRLEKAILKSAEGGDPSSRR